MFQKTNIPGLEKDTRTGVVINTNKGQYEMILAQRKKLQEEVLLKHRVDMLERHVARLMTHLGIEV